MLALAPEVLLLQTVGFVTSILCSMCLLPRANSHQRPILHIGLIHSGALCLIVAVPHLAPAFPWHLASASWSRATKCGAPFNPQSIWLSSTVKVVVTVCIEQAEATKYGAPFSPPVWLSSTVKVKAHLSSRPALGMYNRGGDFRTECHDLWRWQRNGCCTPW